QKVVSNLMSGVILLMDRSVKPGDVIAVGDTYGWVSGLGGRYVSIVTRDGIEHLIPNELMITQTVENWTHSDNKTRLKLPLGVHYDSDVRLAIGLCVEAALETDRVLKQPEPKCLVLGFGDSAVDLELRFWIQDAHQGVRNVRSDVLLRIWDKFHAQGVQIPYPQRDLHIRSAQAVPVEVLSGAAR
ncbi:MAG TPA: mechanosensitive ion channel domain-containing protein, partial [Gammaproteobacteria bacterium]|nr:mechanosensitive ion channel domain-containing protein [Gammaproteobacteria bacterium]